jgi:hypothetical protein
MRMDKVAYSLTVDQKPPHSQSEFIIFQKLSQWVVRVLQSSPRIPLQSFIVSIVMVPIRSIRPPLTFLFHLLIRSNGALASEQDMLVSYESLFLEKCSLCNRFLSAEGYLPPVARVRQEDGTWEPQHGTCVQT